MSIRQKEQLGVERAAGWHSKTWLGHHAARLFGAHGRPAPKNSFQPANGLVGLAVERQ